MAYSFLTEKNIFDLFRESKTYTESLTDPFDEFERIARNRPLPNIDKAYPRVTDGTTASVIRKTPHRIVQQLPTGVVKGKGWLPIVAGFIYQDKILPSANSEYALIQKGWSVIEKSLSFGACPTYTPFVEHGGYFCTDLTVPYWGDIFLQPGKKSGPDCNYIFMRSWWRKEDIESLIDKERKLARNAKARGEVYESSWDLGALRKIKDNLTTKDEKSQTPAEKERQNAKNAGIELITGFQKGVKSKFYTFNMPEESIVRTKINKDPRGNMPIDWMYGDVDGSNPWGRGIVELVGGLQNLIDSDMQMYQYNRALLLNPPVIKRGAFNKNKVKFAPNIIIDIGTDQTPNAGVEALEIDSTAIANYPALYGLQKSQMLNLLASPDTSISAEIGNPGFSKTPAGVKQVQANISVDDNYVRKQYETWFENWSETALNLYFAERSGVEEIQLDKETADKLRKLEQSGELEPGFVSPDDKILLDYDDATEVLKFEVDASTSKMQDDMKTLEGLTALTQALDKSPILQQIVPPDKIIGMWNKLVGVSGVEDPEDLEVDLEEFQAMQQQQQEMAMAQMQTQGLQAEAQTAKAQQQMMQPPTHTMPDGSVMPGATHGEQSQFSPEDEELIQTLQQLGIPEQQIGQALAMLHSGVPAEEIMAMLQEGANVQV